MTIAADVARHGGRGATGLTVLALFVAWEISAQASSGAYVLAAPSEVVVYLSNNAGLIWRASGATLGNAVAGFVLGNLAAVLPAGVAVLLPRSQQLVTGLALVVFCLPLVAMGPILRVVSGPGNGPQIVLAAHAVCYTTLIPLLVGLRAVPASWFDLVRSYGRGGVAALVHVRAMASLPYLFAGLQIAAPAAFLGAMVGEFTGAERGMGVLTIRAMRALDVPMTWALASAATAIAIAACLAIDWIARPVLLAEPPVILAAPPTIARHPLSALGDIALITAATIATWWIVPVAANFSAFFAKGAGCGVRCVVSGW